MKKSKKSAINKTTIKKIASDQAFDPTAVPFKYILGSGNPTYALDRAREAFDETPKILSNLEDEKAKVKTVIGFLLCTLALLEVNNGPQSA